MVNIDSSYKNIHKSVKFGDNVSIKCEKVTIGKYSRISGLKFLDIQREVEEKEEIFENTPQEDKEFKQIDNDKNSSSELKLF